MKGSAITGPVAKECVRIFVVFINEFEPHRNYRPICGPVSRQMPVLWSRFSSFNLVSRIVLFLLQMHLLRTSPHHPFGAASPNDCPSPFKNDRVIP